jgi:SOS-response transcriptional repressor LexA
MTNLEPISGRQREVFEYVAEFVDTNGFCPTFREVCQRFRWASPNAATLHVRRLQARGWLTRTPRGARSLRPTPGAEAAETARKALTAHGFVCVPKVPAGKGSQNPAGGVCRAPATMPAEVAT